MNPLCNATILRRSFLKSNASMILGASAATGSLHGEDSISDESDRLPITIAGYSYDRVKAIQEKRVQVEGCKVRFETDRIGELNQHVFSGSQTREVTEIGLLPFLLAFCNDDFRDYELLPIFVLRLFRHKSIFVRTDRGIKNPEDLRGRKIATPGYSSSSLTWIRGILQHEYGIRPEEVHWVVTGTDSAAKLTGGVSKWEKVLPKNLSISVAPDGKNDSELLSDGDVDAIFHPAEPQIYVDGHPKVDRLFPDHRKVERAYYAKTGIFPIMHLVAIRRDIAAAETWLPKALFKAYSRAKQLDFEEMRKTGWAFSSLPWFGQEYDETRKLMGNNFYPYGIDSSRKTLEAAFRYSHEQRLTKRQLTIEELFNESTLDLSESVSG